MDTHVKKSIFIRDNGDAIVSAK